MSSSRPVCLVLDAGPVIGLHELGAWGAFVRAYTVVVPQLAVDDEALFHSADAATGHRESIDLAADAKDGRILVAAASLNALARVMSRFTAAMELHDGELEALALLTECEGYQQHVFCSADGAAIEAACMLGLADRCLSLDELLAKAGLGRKLAWRYSRRFTEEHKREGGKRAVTGFGLAE